MREQQHQQNAGNLLRWAQTQIPGGVNRSGRLEIDLLLAHVLGVERHDLYLDPSREMSDEETGRFRTLLSERLGGKPLQHLLGEVEFMSLPFRVTPGVFIPRPETECLVERVIERAPKRPSRWIDVGTGAGVVAVSLAVNLPESSVIAVDRSTRAVRLARENAVRNEVGGRVHCVRCNSLMPFETSGWADGIVSNPPYITSAEMATLPVEVRGYDPVSALHGGPDGLDPIRRLIAESAAILAPEGMLAVEIGETQAGAVLSILGSQALWSHASVHPDLTGRNRVVLAVRSE